jgi:hypothetical protein
LLPIKCTVLDRAFIHELGHLVEELFLAIHEWLKGEVKKGERKRKGEYVKKDN